MNNNIKSKFSPITVRFTREFLVGADWNDKLTSETDNGASSTQMTGSFVIFSYQDCPALFTSLGGWQKVSPSILGYLEVHPTPVDPGLALLDVLHPQLGRAGAELEVSPGAELWLVAPPRPQAPAPVSGVVTGQEKMWEAQSLYLYLS